MTTERDRVPTATTGNGGVTPGAAAASPAAIELRGIDKRFGSVHANRAIDMTVRSGTIHGIVGENGAGKSTLMKILYGYYQADSGEIRVANDPVRIANPQDAIAHGIGVDLGRLVGEGVVDRRHLATGRRVNLARRLDRFDDGGFGPLI